MSLKRKEILDAFRASNAKVKREIKENTKHGLTIVEMTDIETLVGFISSNFS
jgi:hypothetical protein